MELDITTFVNAYADCMERFADSVANSGLSNIGEITYRNALAAMHEPENWLCTDLDSLVEHFAEYGAWERDELEAMGGRELNAMLVQFVAGDFQELCDAEESGADMEEWQENHGGSLYQCNVDGQYFGRWYYLIGL